MQLSDLDFELPPQLIAQSPADRRDASRLLHYRRTDGSITDRQFRDLPTLLRDDDLLVFNDARVTPARFTLVKPTGGLVEALFVEQRKDQTWIVLLKSLGQPNPRLELAFVNDPNVTLRAVAQRPDGSYEAICSSDQPPNALLERLGRMPLPPYIRREKTADPRDQIDRERYQTVYAATPGSIAAPTAGLHFTPELLAEIDRRRIERCSVTLHVGLGTFKPVECESLDDHIMHREAFELSEQTAQAIDRAQTARRRIVAIGTTTARVLESLPTDQPPSACRRETDLFIRPPYTWKRVGALVTNFHLPRSTLIAMISAFVGTEARRSIYNHAIQHRYRFFSYGDSSLLE